MKQDPETSRPDPTVAGQWAEVAPTLVPDDASDHQRRDMRRAFYSGVIAYRYLIMTAIKTEEGCLRRRLEIWDAELQHFMLEVDRGMEIPRGSA
jgi:hypothetical protein